MTKKRILFLTPVGEKGGAETVLVNIAERLDRNRYEPSVVCLKPGPLVDELQSMGIGAYGFPSHRTRELHKVADSIRRLRSVVRNEKMDILHATGGNMLFYAGMASLGTSCRCVWHVHDPLAGCGTVERSFVSVQRRFHPAWTMFGNPGVSESYLGTYRNIDRYNTILPGVEPESLIKDADPVRCRTSFNIPEGAPILVMFARLQRIKGHEYLIKAAPAILERYPETRFLICGGSLFGQEPEYPHEIKKMIDEHNLQDRIQLLGYVTDQQKRDVLAAATIVVHPALAEPFGISVIEGMAVGKPVVATDCMGPLMTMIDNETGRLVPKGDATALAKAILDVLDQPDQAVTMGRHGRTRVNDNFTVAAMVKQVEAVYETL